MGGRGSIGAATCSRDRNCTITCNRMGPRDRTRTCTSADMCSRPRNSISARNHTVGVDLVGVVYMLRASCADRVGVIRIIRIRTAVVTDSASTIGSHVCIDSTLDSADYD